MKHLFFGFLLGLLMGFSNESFAQTININGLSSHQVYGLGLLMGSSNESLAQNINTNGLSPQQTHEPGAEKSTNLSTTIRNEARGWTDPGSHPWSLPPVSR